MKVSVVSRGKAGLYLRWVDPVTGKNVEKKAESNKRREALVEAGVMQHKLEEGNYKKAVSMRWTEFRNRFSLEYLHGSSDGYRKNVNATFNKLEAVMAPNQLQAAFSTDWLLEFRRRVSNPANRHHVAEYTVKKYFQHLRTMIEWAAQNGMISVMPKIPPASRRAPRKRHMKGRPVTAEEFDRMLAKAPTEPLKMLMRGLWLSGLRLGEALSLTWDQWADGIRIDRLPSGDLVLKIDGDDQKNGRIETYPVVDEFADFLLKHQQDAHEDGWVFNPTGRRGTISRRVDSVSDWIKATGKAARVRVDKLQGRDVFAGAHDLRRAFGVRWSGRVPAPVLQRLMRHEDISTTMKFYVGQDAQREIDAARAAMERQVKSPEQPARGKRTSVESEGE